MKISKSKINSFGENSLEKLQSIKINDIQYNQKQPQFFFLKCFRDNQGSKYRNYCNAKCCTVLSVGYFQSCGSFFRSCSKTCEALLLLNST